MGDITYDKRLNISLTKSQSAVNHDGSIFALEFENRIDFFNSSLGKYHSINCSVGGIEFDPSNNILYYTDILNNDIVAIETINFNEIFRTSVSENLLSSSSYGLGQGEMLKIPDSNLLFLSTTQGVRVIEVIPEPTTLLLLGLGGILIRKRK